jgi:hypothetical protein
MDISEVYPDVLGDALSFSSQRLAQRGSLVTAGATVVARRKAEAAAARAERLLPTPGESEKEPLRLTRCRAVCVRVAAG